MKLAAADAVLPQQHESCKMLWLEDSIMARKAVAPGRPTGTYEITEAKQGTYHYVDLGEPVILRHPADQLAVGNARGILHWPPTCC